MKRYIGVFDSGFGGLNILKGLNDLLPEYDYIYLGDTARTPYGSRSKEIISKFTEQAVNFLFQKNCELVILACNTASSDALRKIQINYLPKNHPGKKVLGVLVPMAEAASKDTKNLKIGVLATESTISSGSYEKELKIINNKIIVYQKSAPLLVPLVESGENDEKIVMPILNKYLLPLKEKKIDTLILGCTHYGILKSKIREIMGPEVEVVSGQRTVPKSLEEYLKNHSEIENRLSKGGSKTFLTTDLSLGFEKLGCEFYGEKIKVEKITLN